MNIKELIRGNLFILVFIILIISLVLAIVFSNPLVDLRHFFIDQHLISFSIVYSLIVTISIIFSPIAITPIIPFIAKIFGPEHTFFLTFIGVFLGSGFSFLLAKYFGRQTILKIFSKNSLEKIESKIPRNLKFSDIIFFRFFLPPDGLSYFLGLHSKISFLKYITATAFGLFPIVFILTYGPDGLSGENKILFFLLIVAILLIFSSYLFYRFLLFKKTVKLVTHSESFHLDDIFSSATLSLFLNKRGIKYKIIRTRDEKLLNKYKEQAKINIDKVFIYDVGKEYNSKYNLFDHHQEDSPVRNNGIPYSSFGLVWKKYGEKICGSSEIAKILDKKICLPIDAMDNGILLSENIKDIKPYSLNSFISSFHPISNKKEDIEEAFNELVKIFQKVIKKEIQIISKEIKDKEIFDKIYNSTKNKSFIIIDDEKLLLPKDFTDYLELNFIIKKSLNGGYRILTIPNDLLNSFKRKKYFPESWSGKEGEELEKITGVKGAKFCHKGGFLAVANTIEAAEKIVKLII